MIDQAQLQQQPVQNTQPPAPAAPQQTAQATVQTTTTAVAPDRATAVAAVDQAVSGIGQAIGSDLAKTPTAVAGVVLAVIVVAVIAAILGFGYLLVQAVSQHSPQAQQYVAAIGDKALSVGLVVLAALGLWAAPPPQVK